MNKIKIKEIFTSIQGEGPFVGYKQLFIRFCKCNLNCKYCDTDFSINNTKEYTAQEIINICRENADCHSISLTGGEPLLNIDFLKEFLPNSTLPVYLETNATLHENLKEILEFVQYISADIKLPSTSGNKNLWKKHEKFFEIAKEKILFAKIVFDSNITEEEIIKASELVKKFNIELILQPMMVNNKPSVTSDFMQEILNRFLKYHKKTRLIPQIHKFINVL